MDPTDVITTTSTDIDITPLKRGGRMDVVVHEPDDVAAQDADVIAKMRAVVSVLEAEAQVRKNDPVAMVNALARMEALMADVRYVRDTVKQNAADALHDQRIRRMTVEGVATVEASNTAARSDWQDERLLRDVLRCTMAADTHTWVDAGTGERLDIDELASATLKFFRPTWRVTPMKDHNLDPDSYSTLEKDEHGKTVRTPAVQMKDNLIRRNGQ